MTLLLGPPGAGKSTLLLALAGKLDSDLQVKFHYSCLWLFEGKKLGCFASFVRLSHWVHNQNFLTRAYKSFSIRGAKFTSGRSDDFVTEFVMVDVYIRRLQSCYQIVSSIYYYELMNCWVLVGFYHCRAQEQSPTMVMHSASLCLKGHLHTSVKMITILESLLYERPWILQLDAKEWATDMVIFVSPYLCFNWCFYYLKLWPEIVSAF